jgi:predicted PurR-regulated permease PerM
MRFLSAPRDRAGFLILVLAAGILYLVAPFIIGLLGAAVLYAVCVGPYRAMRRHLHPDLAASITLIGAVIGIALPLVWLVSLVVAQAPEILRGAQQSDLLTKVAGLRIAGLDVGEQLARAGGTAAAWVSRQAFSVVGSAAQAVINLFIAFFGLYYMLRSGDELWTSVRPFIPFSAATADALRVHFFSITRATLLGTAVTALLQGGIVGAGFWIVGLPHPLFWGTMTGFASILPVLGSGLIWLPGVLVLLANERFGPAIVLLAIGGVVASNIDNVIRPIVYKRVSDIHPMITLLGAFAGVKYFGLPGVLLGPLAIAYLFELIDFYRKEYSGAADNTPEVPGPG